VWANVKVNGKTVPVLVQAFERRVLTYTPDNPVLFRVEYGNIGRAYYAWRA
ncbi:MAG: peptidase domain-containing protein, partial [Thermomicrobia bacterium]|nr:peptidase domain-containing protein [Thermomicrobia bacterium]